MKACIQISEAHVKSGAINPVVYIYNPSTFMARWEVETGGLPDTQGSDSLADAMANNNKEKKNEREGKRETLS